MGQLAKGVLARVLLDNAKSSTSQDPFKNTNFRVNSSNTRKIAMNSKSKRYNVDIEYVEDGTFKVNNKYEMSGSLLKNNDGELIMSWRCNDGENESRGRWLVVKHDSTAQNFTLFDHSTGDKFEFSHP